MILTFEGLDNEFAVSTGSNVNSGSNTSDFDYPPTSTKDLLITSNAGDSDPRLFELGETYDISFAGNGGTTLEDAVVIRSDLAPGGGGGVIVFEGNDPNGDLTQVVWTPGFDLETWYFDNFSGGTPPEFYTADQDPAYTHSYICFHARVPLHTPKGLVAAGQVSPGDVLCTWGGGREEVIWTGRRRVPAMGDNAPVRFEVGAIGNMVPIKLSPQHRVLVTAPRARALYDSDDVLAPAAGLVNGRTIRRKPQAEITYVHILTRRHAILIAAGAPCESLFLGPMAEAVLTKADLADIGAVRGAEPMRPARPMLSVGETRRGGLSWRIPRGEPAQL